MALLWMDSFDLYATADMNEIWTSSGVTAGTGCTIGIAASGRRSSAGLQWVTGNSPGIAASVSRNLSPGDATVILGFALNVSATSTAALGTTIAQIRDSAFGIQVSLRINQAMTLSVIRGSISGGTVLGTTAAPIPSGAYAYIEWKTLIANSGGTTQVRINGVSVLSLTGLDTQNTALADWASFSLGQIENLSGSNDVSSRTINYDDLYVLDGTGAAPWNGLLGDCRVDAGFPTGPGANAGFTPSTGANWSCVDETPPNDDTDYTSGAAPGLTDTFVMPDVPVPGSAIYGVRHCLNAKKMDAGAAALAPVIRVSGTDYAGGNLAPGTTYAYLVSIAAVNPATGAQWTEAAFNAAEFGYRKTI